MQKNGITLLQADVSTVYNNSRIVLYFLDHTGGNVGTYVHTNATKGLNHINSIRPASRSSPM